MPRSFLAESDRVLAAMTPLEETDHHTNEDETDDDDSGEWSEGSNVQEAQADEVQQVKTYVQALTLLDVESCVALEDSAFPPQERCSREKVCVPHVSRTTMLCMLASLAATRHQCIPGRQACHHPCCSAVEALH